MPNQHIKIEVSATTVYAITIVSAVALIIVFRENVEKVTLIDALVMVSIGVLMGFLDKMKTKIIGNKIK